jgi:5-methylcytosine-specific restriction protein A
LTEYTVTPVEVAYDTPRSPGWPAVRKTHLEKEPACRACGGKNNLEVHHVKPFHLFPDLELVDSNLITLCMEPGHGCHFIFGHLLDYQAYNLTVETDANNYLSEVKNRRTA